MQKKPDLFCSFRISSVRKNQPQEPPPCGPCRMLNLPASGQPDPSGFRDGDTQRPLYPMVTCDLTYHWNHWQTCATTTYQWFESLWIYQRLGFALLIPGYLSVSRPAVGIVAVGQFGEFVLGPPGVHIFPGNYPCGSSTKKLGGCEPRRAKRKVNGDVVLKG